MACCLDPKLIPPRSQTKERLSPLPRGRPGHPEEVVCEEAFPCAECASRADAERLRGTTLAVPRDALPPLGEGEFYHADLLGLPVVTDAGDVVGTVLAIENFGATDIIEITRDPVPEKGPKTFMVPMIPAAVPEWNAERLVIVAAFAEA